MPRGRLAARCGEGQQHVLPLTSTGASDCSWLIPLAQQTRRLEATSQVTLPEDLLSASARSADTADMEAAGSPLLERLYVPLAIVGVVLVWTTSIAGSGFSLLSLPFALWSTAPYAVLWIVGRRLQNPWLVI